jgi:hypothetical protein
MDLRFQPTHDLREALNAVRQITDKAILSVRSADVHIITNDGVCSGSIILPQDFFMDFHVAPDSFAFSIEAMQRFIQKDSIVNIKDFPMDLETSYIDRPERVYQTRVRCEVTELLRPIKGDSEFYVKERFKVNGQAVKTLKIQNPGGFFSKMKVRSHYSGEYLKKIVLHISRYCNVSFATDAPLHLEYATMGLRLFFVLAPMAVLQ